MQRAARLLTKLKQRDARLGPGDLASAIWPTAVGKRLAQRTGPVKLFGTRLVVDVEDAVWQKQLQTLAGQILGKLQQAAGPGVIDQIEFRIGAPRRPPQPALHISPAGDRADGILDPIFRQLYLASRAQVERVEELRKRIPA